MEKLSLTGKSVHSTDDTLKGLSAVFVDGDRIFIDNGAIHAKSELERSVTFAKSKDELSSPRLVYVFWITLKRSEGKMGFHGAMPFVIWIDEQAKLGYKSLAEQVNKMDKAVRGQIDLSDIPDEVRLKVRDFLVNLRPDLWENAATAFRAAFDDEEMRKG
jgi:YwhD family